MTWKKYNVLFLLLILFGFTRVVECEEAIQWPFRPYPSRAKNWPQRRPENKYLLKGAFWYKDGWPIPQDGAFGAPRTGHDHRGIDILANVDTRVYPIEPGEVVVSARIGKAGQIIIIQGRYRTAYMHLSKRLKEVGETVKITDLDEHIGLSGNSSREGEVADPVDGPHLHLEINRGANNPLDILPDDQKPTIVVNNIISDYGKGNESDVYSIRKGNLNNPVVKGKVRFGFTMEDDVLVKKFEGKIAESFTVSHELCDKKPVKSVKIGPYSFNPNAFLILPNHFNYFPEWRGVFLKARSKWPTFDVDPNPDSFRFDEFDINPKALVSKIFDTTKVDNGFYELRLWIEDYVNNGSGTLDLYRFPFTINNPEKMQEKPGCENPDDNFSFAEPFIENDILTSDVIRIAVKKEKRKVLKHVEKEREYLRLLSEREKYIKSLPPSSPDEGDPCSEEITDPILLDYFNKLNSIYGYLQYIANQRDDEIEECADVAMLRHGKYDSTRAFLSDLHIPTKLIDPDLLTPLLVKEYPVLVIPTGGLYGLDNAEQFKSALAEYASSGGTIIALTQKYGYEFAGLPAPGEIPLASYGWNEDQSCHTNSMYVDT